MRVAATEEGESRSALIQKLPSPGPAPLCLSLDLFCRPPCVIQLPLTFRGKRGSRAAQEKEEETGELSPCNLKRQRETEGRPTSFSLPNSVSVSDRGPRPRYRCFALDTKEEKEEEAMMMMVAIRLNYDRGGGGQITSEERSRRRRTRRPSAVRPMTYKCPKPKKTARMQREMGEGDWNECDVCSINVNIEWRRSRRNTIQEHINPRIV